MYTLAELKRQNQEISDLVEVLSALLKEKHLMCNPLVCELVSRFNEKVWMHLVFEDDSIYAELCKHHNPDISSLAKQFHDASRAIKKDFSNYMKLWCKVSGTHHDQQAFCDQTAKMLEMIKQRIQFETDNLFPLVEAA